MAVPEPSPATPRSLRIARLLLVGAAAASAGCVAVILSRAAGISPYLAFFVIAGVLFFLAARALEHDPSGGRLLATAAAFTLAAIGVLAGFGAGDITFPAAGLGVLAAWAAWLQPPRRRVTLAFAAYVAAGVVATFPRFLIALAYPWTLATLFLWPWTSLLAFGPFLGSVLIYGSFAVALAIVAAYVARRLPRERAMPTPRLIAVATLAGAVALGAFVAIANVRTNTSARFELEPVALATVFVAATIAAFGVLRLRSAPALATIACGIGGVVLLFAFLSRPTVECGPGSASTAPGPWWSSWRGGSVSSTGSVGPDGSASGTIRRDDGSVIRYSCSGAIVVSFSIER
jgi:hypothetical protein